MTKTARTRRPDHPAVRARHVRQDRNYAAWLLAATTGMRRGELLGLRWIDVDLAAGRVAIRQPRVVVDHAVYTSEPKTARSRRSIALDPRRWLPCGSTKPARRPSGW
jgi:integrase